MVTLVDRNGKAAHTGNRGRAAIPAARGRIVYIGAGGVACLDGADNHAVLHNQELRGVAVEDQVAQLDHGKAVIFRGVTDGGVRAPYGSTVLDGQRADERVVRIVGIVHREAAVMAPQPIGCRGSIRKPKRFGTAAIHPNAIIRRKVVGVLRKGVERGACLRGIDQLIADRPVPLIGKRVFRKIDRVLIARGNHGKFVAARIVFPRRIVLGEARKHGKILARIGEFCGIGLGGIFAVVGILPKHGNQPVAQNLAARLLNRRRISTAHNAARPTGNAFKDRAEYVLRSNPL